MNCYKNYCSGVFEFFGVKGEYEMSLRIKSKEEEYRYIVSNIPTVLYFRCSKCNTLDAKFNSAFDKVVNENEFFY